MLAPLKKARKVDEMLDAQSSLEKKYKDQLQNRFERKLKNSVNFEFNRE